MIKFKVKVDVDESKLQSKRRNATKGAQMQLDQDVLKDSNYYAPQDESHLINSSIRASQIGKGKLIWDTKYARRLYYNPQYSFSKDKNPNARGLWFEAAKANKKAGWIEKARRNYKKFFAGRGR